MLKVSRHTDFFFLCICFGEPDVKFHKQYHLQLLLAVHDKHVTPRGQPTEGEAVYSTRCPKEGSLPTALAAPQSPQAPGPSLLHLQFHGLKMDAAAPGITNPFKVTKYRAKHISFLVAFLQSG